MSSQNFLCFFWELEIKQQDSSSTFTKEIFILLDLAAYWIKQFWDFLVLFKYFVASSIFREKNFIFGVFVSWTLENKKRFSDSNFKEKDDLFKPFAAKKIFSRGFRNFLIDILVYTNISLNCLRQQKSFIVFGGFLFEIFFLIMEGSF